jgi:SAM-dependent methyltransferase
VKSGPALDDVVAYFDGKTHSILQRYGPGPRVHYHTGLLDGPPPEGARPGELRRGLVQSQEIMLREAARAWNAQSRLCGEVLDVGCGLGGGSIFWAEECGAKVTALTCVPSHIPWVRRFAEQAGVADRVSPVVGDACETAGKEMFDAVVCIDASGYLARAAWFERAAALLRPGGAVFVIDCFLEDRSYAEIFDCHWRTRIGTLAEYFTAAGASGLSLGDVVDVSERTRHFWTTTLALIELETEAEGADRSRCASSRRAHALVRDGLTNGGFRYAMLTFEKKASTISRHSASPTKAEPVGSFPAGAGASDFGAQSG